MQKIIRPAVLAVILLVVTSGYALFLQPLIGLADNGDFGRVMLPNGLQHELTREESDYFGYFNHKFDRLQYFNEAKENIKSSHSIIIKFAMAVDDILSNDGKFDIRNLAIICFCVLALSIYWIVEVVEKMVDSKRLKYFFALLAVIIFGDIGYTSYLNSFYGEAVAYPFFLLSIASMLKFTSHKEFKKRYLLIYFIASFMFMGAKNQFSFNGILSFLLLVLLLFFKIENKKKMLSVALGFILLGCSLLMYLIIDENIYLINKYHMMTRGVMLFEPDVQAITKEVGLNEQFSLLAQTIYFDRTPTIDPKDEILQKEFYSNYNLFSVSFYYLTHPQAFTKIMEFGWKNSFTIRPEVIGNYERQAGRGYGEKTNFFSLWSYFKENNIPHSANFAYFFLIICLALTINRVIVYKNRGINQIVYYREIIMLYVLLTGFSQLLVTFIGAGDADLKKHLFMTTVSLDILFYYNFAYIISILYKIRENW